jgi:D-amino peptidase
VWLRSSRAIQVVLLAGLTSCAGAPPGGGKTANRSCALIETDDDITSGSATAGALFVGEDDLGRRLLTADVAAVAQGFRDAGYDCIVVADSHERALDHDRLVKLGLRVVSPATDREWRWPFFGVAGPEFKIAALVGFHARAGARGFRPHTVNDFVRRVTINGVETGEVGIAILGLSALGMSPVLVVGDEGAVVDARDIAPRVRAVAVRWHDETGATRFLSDVDAARVLRNAAREALGRTDDALRPTP